MTHPVAIIRELLPLQDDFNRRVNPDWINAGYPFHRAIWMEGAEFVEGTNGWKWWKAPGEFDLIQLQIEVIDKLHFLLSWGLVIQSSTSADDVAAETIGSALQEHALKPAETFDVNAAIDAVENLVSAAAGKLYDKSVQRFAQLVPICQLSVTDLRRMYIAKNALNTVRNLNGYKSGTYQKLWRGEEDNLHLERIMGERPGIGLADLIDALTARYKECLAA